MSKKLNYNPNDFVCNIPIEERLKNVPEDAEWWVHQWPTSDHFEIGRICREAYNKLNEQQAEIEALKLHIQGLQASITLGEKYMARKNPVETLENIGAILRKAGEK